MSNTEIHPAPDIDSRPAPAVSKWEREKRAFRKLLPSLLPTHRGLYVAIHNELAVGIGADQRDVARQAWKQYGYVPIYVGLITDEPARIVRVPSPRVNAPAS